MRSDFVNFSAQTPTDILKAGRAFDNTVGGVGQFVVPGEFKTTNAEIPNQFA